MIRHLWYEPAPETQTVSQGRITRRPGLLTGNNVNLG